MCRSKPFTYVFSLLGANQRTQADQQIPPSKKRFLYYLEELEPNLDNY